MLRRLMEEGAAEVSRRCPQHNVELPCNVLYQRNQGSLLQPDFHALRLLLPRIAMIDLAAPLLEVGETLQGSGGQPCKHRRPGKAQIPAATEVWEAVAPTQLLINPESRDFQSGGKFVWGKKGVEGNFWC